MLSNEVLDRIQAEADALGLKGATAISLAVRAALTERKKVGKVPDERTQTYWVAGRVVSHGSAFPAPGVAEAKGLLGLSQLARDLEEFHTEAAATLPEGCLKDQVSAARVNLSRKGEAHVQAVWGANLAGEASAWVDLWVFPTEAAAELCAQSLKAGKIF